MTNVISVKDRLKKQAIEDGKTMQDKLVTYGLERTIYRLSVSNHVNMKMTQNETKYPVEKAKGNSAIFYFKPKV